jgi:hypothetical protein
LPAFEQTAGPFVKRTGNAMAFSSEVDTRAKVAHRPDDRLEIRSRIERGAAPAGRTGPDNFLKFP